uniref:Uncharacterized protein n=1 Tax=Leersia perrieri TaxID=77586 RepID=A0A0D9WCS7_9ORYZ
MAARKNAPAPWKTTKAASGSSSSSSAAKKTTKAKTKRKRKEKPLPPLLAPGTAVEVLRNGAWVGGGRITIRNDRTYMVCLGGGMTVLATRRRVRPAYLPPKPPAPAAAAAPADVSPKAAGD